MKRWMWLVPLIGGALAYVNVLGNGFVLDDHHFVVDNPDVAALHPLHLLWSANATSVTFFYRPLALFIHALEHSLFGFRAALFHLDSVVAHLACVLLLTRLVWKWTGRPAAALFAGLLFAVHPVHTEAVTAIANRSEVLATLFYLAALNLEWLEWLQWNDWSVTRRRVAQNGMYLCALLCKESAITLPIALAALIYLRGDKKRFAVAALALLPGLFMYIGLRAHALGGLAGDTRVLYFRSEHGLVRVLTVCKFLAVYLRLLVYPVSLLPDYSRYTIEDAHSFEPAVLVGLAFVGATLGAVLIFARRQPVVAFGATLVALGLLPYAHFIPMSGALAERFVYLPSAGFFIVAAVALDQAGQRLSRPWLAGAALAVVSLWLIARTLDRNLDWRSDVALWKAAVETAPRNGAAHILLAEALYNAGQTEPATEQLQIAITLYPSSSKIRLQLAGYYHLASRHDDERRVLHAAIESGNYDDEIVHALRAAEWNGHDDGYPK